MSGEHGNESDTTLYEVSSCTSTTCVVAAMLSDEISSVHCSIIPSMSRGNLDKLSASLFSRPGRYESANSATHLQPVALRFALDSTYVRWLLSLKTVNVGASYK